MNLLTTILLTVASVYVARFGRKDCVDLRLEGETRSATYSMFLQGKIVQIPCDMTTDGGGWTVFQRRVDGTVNFQRNWKSYKEEFGDRNKNFWLGLDLIHYMISRYPSEMRIDMTSSSGAKGYAHYSNSYINGESQGYQLVVSNYKGTAGNGLSPHSNTRFSTLDRDNDKWKSSNCAQGYSGGFWYTNCYTVNLNGEYSPNKEAGSKGMSWYLFTTSGISFCEMKFRRKT